MNPTAFDCDEVLTDFLSDYLDGNLTAAEQESFEEYLSENREERIFVRKAKQGKQALARLAEHIDVCSVTA